MSSTNEELIQLARTNLVAFAKVMFGDEYQINRFHNYLAGVLQKAIAREEGYTRICISVPPQHGKSFLVSQLFPSWAIGHSKAMGIKHRENVTSVAYAASLAMEFGGEVRRICSSPKYKLIFPETALSGDGKSGANIRFPNRSTYRAVGFGGALTGYPTSIMLPDDVTKNRAEADSKAYLHRLHSGFGPNMYTRLQEDALLINTQTRWSEQDLTGYLLDKYTGDNWLYIRLPALCDDPEHDLLSRAEGEALAPHRFTRETLLKTKGSMSVRDWAALYQNDPIAGAGTFWRPEYYLSGTAPALWEFELLFSSWDCANEMHSAADYTACTVWGLYQGRIWLIYAERWQVDFVGLCDVFLEVQDKFNLAFNIVEKAQNGVALANWMSVNKGIAIECYPAQRQKGSEFAQAAKAFDDQLVWWDDVAFGEMPMLSVALQELSKWPSTANDDLAMSVMFAVRWLQTNKSGMGKYTALQSRANSKAKPKILRKKPMRRFGAVA